jgi:hypothetical protein
MEEGCIGNATFDLFEDTAILLSKAPGSRMATIILHSACYLAYLRSALLLLALKESINSNEKCVQAYLDVFFL